MKPKEVVVNDLMQKGYRYCLTEPMGEQYPNVGEDSDDLAKG